MATATPSAKSEGTEPDKKEALVMGELHTRFNRQLDFVPALSLEGKRVTVIGCGAIGRPIALQLASIGVRDIQLIDHDLVSPTNVTTQGYLEGDVGETKVHALERALKAIDHEIQVEPVCDKYRPKYKAGAVVFVCVDCIAARTAIFEELKDKVEMLIDCRMLGEIWRVLVVHDAASKEHYAKTLFKPEEQAKGRCTGHATVYSATMPASWAIHQMTRGLRGAHFDIDMECNMFAAELCPVTLV